MEPSFVAALPFELLGSCMRIAGLRDFDSHNSPPRYTGKAEASGAGNKLRGLHQHQHV